ncbi:MAG TPA: Na+/H+ antiporter [Candidatus Cryosericum sp.]|nr:Na+/H+ antiporter [Candidatus Cryosericum sp.]
MILPGLVATLALIGLASVVAPRIKIPAAVLLALTGIAWALLPGWYALRIDPQVVLSVFLPPLLYAEAWRASWRDFHRWLRPILSLAIGLVSFTILCVGLTVRWLMPELPWAVCFLIGAIVSPTDTVAVHEVLHRLRIPRRATAIIGGESLVNDATGLLGVQLALIVILTGLFEWGAILTEFARIAGLGIACGVAVGFLAIGLNARLRGTAVLFVSSLFAPYLAYAVADAAGASGILSVVVAGFVASWRIDLIPPDSRVELTADWDVLTFILNALMFLFVGLATPRLLAADPAAAPGLLVTGLAIGAMVVVARLVWFWPAAYIPLWLFPRLREREGGYPAPAAVVLAQWCGVRGAVSLAAALAIPSVLPSGEPFPGHAIIQVSALMTILITLFGQGATVGGLVRWLRLSSDAATEAETRQARETMLAAGIARLDAFCSEESCPISVYRYRDVLTDRLAELRAIEENERRHATRRLEISREVRRAVWQAETAELLRLRDAGRMNDRDHQDLQLEIDREHADLATET